jgi:hypothetical protein
MLLRGLVENFILRFKTESIFNIVFVLSHIIHFYSPHSQNFHPVISFIILTQLFIKSIYVLVSMHRPLFLVINQLYGVESFVKD